MTKTRQKITINKHKLFWIFIGLFLFVESVIADEHLNIKEMGDFSLSWNDAIAVTLLSGQPRLGLVDHTPGASYALALPFSIQKINYHKVHGEFILKGHTLATISGPEVNHYKDIVASAEALYEVSKKHYQASEAGFKDNIIQNPGWFSLVENYHQAKIEFAHHHHIMGLLSYENAPAVQVKAPITGYVQINANYKNLKEQAIVEIVPEDAFLVAVNIPIDLVDSLSHLSVKDNDCNLTPSIRERQINAHFVKIWSKFDADTCSLQPGESLSVVPHFTFNGFRVSHSSVFRLEDGLHVAVKNNDDLSVHSISIQESDDDFHYVTSHADLNNAKLLSSSVGVLQGILLGMGGE